MSSDQSTLPAAGCFYYLADDREVVPSGDQSWLIKSSTATISISGPHARFVIEQLLSAIGHGCRWSQLAAHFAEVEPIMLRELLDDLVQAGILRASMEVPAPKEATLAPLLNILEEFNLPGGVATGLLAGAAITIFGLEGVGAHLALMLARQGIREFMLVDPFPCEPGNLPLLPLSGKDALGRSRQDVVAEALRQVSPDPQLLRISVGPLELTPENVAQLVASADCVASCFDRGFKVSHHWINRASLASKVPVVYAEADGTDGWAGPLVLPGQTACYMCYIMRSVAAAASSSGALAIERYFDRQRLPRLHERAVIPSLMPQLAAFLATNVLQVVVGLDQPALAGRVLQCGALTLQAVSHTVMQHPACSCCGAPGPAEPDQPTLAILLESRDQPVDLQEIAPHLVSQHCGLIRQAGWYEKDAVEPAPPFICEVALADYQYDIAVQAEQLTCWGKGLTHDEALVSGLGEAIERYAGDQVEQHTIIYARRAELDGPSIDPRTLTLYGPEQYASVPYHPYTESSVLGWVRSRELVSGQLVYAPALAVFMGYQARSSEEYLFPVTSNGLAAGASRSHAILAAAYECLERDAFMITWYARLPALRVDPLSHPDGALRDLCRLYQRRGVEIALWRLPTDHPCAVFLALGLEGAQGNGPALIAGLGADLDVALAARKAILEVGQIRPSYRRALRQESVRRHIDELVRDPQRVSTMHDHGLIYCSHAMRHAADFLLACAVEQIDWRSPAYATHTEHLAQLVQCFRAREWRLLYYDLTPADLARWGLAVTRVIMPGFQPVSFGAREPRLGGQRLFELPHRLGLARQRLSMNDLNPYPHPFD